MSFRRQKKTPPDGVSNLEIETDDLDRVRDLVELFYVIGQRGLSQAGSLRQIAAQLNRLSLEVI